MPHVYAIVCLPTGESYVGSSVMPEGRRWSNHRSHLRAGRHPSEAMQRAYDRYGEDAFRLDTIVVCPTDAPLDDLLRYEQAAMDVMKPAFNTAPRAGPVMGLKRTSEQVAARRAAFGGTSLALRNADPPRYEVRGEMLSLREISARYGVKLNTVRTRYARGRRGEGLLT